MVIQKTTYGLSFILMDPEYLNVIREKMPWDTITAEGQIDTFGSILVYAAKNRFYDCYEVIDNEFDLIEIGRVSK